MAPGRGMGVVTGGVVRAVVGTGGNLGSRGFGGEEQSLVALRLESGSAATEKTNRLLQLSNQERKSAKVQEHLTTACIELHAVWSNTYLT